MILVRHVFQCKWGHSQQVVDNMKQMVGHMHAPGSVRILTDLSGTFDTVVQEVVVESLAEWERGRAELFASPEFQKMQEELGSEPPFVSGHAEFYTIEHNYGD